MLDSEVEQWCQQHNWTEPRQLDIGIWVAFPPNGYIETPLPLQAQKPKAKYIESILDAILLVIVSVTMLAIAIVMSPCFIKPIINRYYQKKCQDQQ